MTPSEFRGERLRVLRLAHGWTQKALAERVVTDKSTISKLERDEFPPSELLLEALVQVTGVTCSFFSHPIRRELRREECSFRHLQAAPLKALDQASARGTLVQELVARLELEVNLPQPSVPSIRATSTSEIEAAAATCRDEWDLGSDLPIASMIRVAEHAGVVVSRLRGGSEKLDALSFAGDRPLIVLSSTKASSSRERYSVAHELGHLVFHRGQETGGVEREKEANLFAKCLLLPRDQFSMEFRAMGSASWTSIFELKDRWKAPGPAILQRASTLGLVDAVSARRLYKQHSARGWQKSEPHEPPFEEPELIDHSLDLVERFTGKGIRELADDLGHGPVSSETLLGLPFPPEPIRFPENVTAIKDFVRR